MILSFFRTAVLYILLIAVIRLMGKRQIGQMEPSEFVVTMLAANLAAIPMEDSGIPLYSGVVPIVTVLGVELVLSGISMSSIRFRRILCGKPVIMIENGRILRENLLKTRVTLDELTGHLREKDVLDLTTVQYAILETNGNLSVFPFPKEMPPSAKDLGLTPKDRFLPVTIIEDGFLFRENLREAGKDEAWVHSVLGDYRSSIAGTWLLTVDKSGHVVWLGREAGK